MSLRYLPLRWESTGDQWWYASPIDCAAANGHYDLVRELLRIDNNHLFKLTSLRRIRRLELVWDEDDDDDEQQFNGVAKCRAEVAQKLLLECESKRGNNKKNSLIRAGYGGWLMYTAASAGDFCFVKQLLERNPLLVFGEGEYSVTDIFYAASRGKNCEVFWLLFDYAVMPRFVKGKSGVLEEHVGEIPSVYKWEMTNRAVHAASRGGNVEILEKLLVNCYDVLGYRDAQGSTVLHSAAATGQVQVVRYLTSSSFDIINSTDHHGNTALHVAAYRGQLATVETLVSSSSTLISLRNNTGETFLHKAVSGFQSPAFKRLDRQVGLLRKLLSDKKFHIEKIINAKNTDGRTALHIATIGNIHTDLVKLLMTAPLINVNISDVDGMTPLDYLRQSPNSSISGALIRKLISAGGKFQYNSRKAKTSSHKKMHSVYSSPGTSFRISDTQMFLYTGIENENENASDDSTDQVQGSAGMSSTTSSEITAYDSAPENRRPSTTSKKSSSAINNAAEGLKRVLHWHRVKNESSDETPTPTPTSLRQRFFKLSSLPNNKRSLCVRSYQSSPNAKKRFASGLVLHGGDTKSLQEVKVSRRSRSSSFSISSVLSSPKSMEKQKGMVCVNSSDDVAGPSCSSYLHHEGESPNLRKGGSVSKKLRGGHYFCFGEPRLNVVKTSVNMQQERQS